MLRFAFTDGSLKFYVNELTPGGEVEMIEDDEEFEEISMFMELALNKYKHGVL